jgi:hypothetical protein
VLDIDDEKHPRIKFSSDWGLQSYEKHDHNPNRELFKAHSDPGRIEKL